MNCSYLAVVGLSVGALLLGAFNRLDGQGGEVTCLVCDVHPAAARGRCRTCYRYWLRTGRDRAPTLVDRALRRASETSLVSALIGGITRL